MQFTEVPVEILKENAGFFKEQICSQSNETINSSILSTSTYFQRWFPETKRVITGQLVSYQSLQEIFDNIFSKFECGFWKDLVPFIVFY